MKKLLILFFILSSLCCFGQTDSIIKSQIKLVRLSDKGLNVIFESKNYKFYFSKKDLIKFIESNCICYDDDTLDTKAIANDLKSNYKTKHYVDVEWYLKLKAKKYNYLEQKEGITNEKRSDSYIIEHNPYLHNSCDFKYFLISYLHTGKFKIYDKKKRTFLSLKNIELNHIITILKNGQSDKYIYLLNKHKIIFEYEFGYLIMD